MANIKISNLAALLFLCCTPVFSQDYWEHLKKKEPTLEIEKGYNHFRTRGFILKLVKSSQTVAGLFPRSEPDFDFTPGDRIGIRDKDSLYHLGDINLRLRIGQEPWKEYKTATARQPVDPIKTELPVLAGANLTNTFSGDLPLLINRFYVQDGDDLIIRFELTNTSDTTVEIGALGIPMIFNNILDGKTLDEAHAGNVFFDPYMGMDAGYLEVKRLSGRGPSLLVLPEENMPFENYRPLLDDLTRRSVVFEGFHEWMGYSTAYAEHEWKGVSQWNNPSSLFIKPGETRNVSLRLALTAGVREVWKSLVMKNRPFALGIPGYVLPQDVKAQLFLKYTKEISSIRVVPEGVLEISGNRDLKSGYGYIALQVKGKKWGRARVEVNYSDGSLQTVHYKVIKPEDSVVEDYGRFLTTNQWFDDKEDPFGRTPSVISYDYETRSQVTQDGRVWIAGLSDEGGAGSWLGAFMKQLVKPDRAEVEKLENFIQNTLWGGIQYDKGPNKYGVKKSLFYYEPEQLPADTYEPRVNYGTWAAWDKAHAYSVGRSYNYPHVAAAHWVMYRLARYYSGLVTKQTWRWYLDNAYHTTIAMPALAPDHARFGQMEGTVFLLILEDLKREGLEEMAKNLEDKMKERALHWRSLNYPFGSEMPWDSTGQEEVYMWSDYFGFDEKARITLNAILAYMPTIPHWAYNGNARRYWDFVYGGKLQRIERQIHHYGSGLNAIPVLAAYRKDPENFDLLNTGYGGLLGAISNITEDGFGPAAFHSFPSTLRIDGLSGDFGSGFFGYAVNTATYITHEKEFGWLVFGGNSTENKEVLSVDISTASKQRIYIGPEKSWITLDAGKINRIDYQKNTGELTLFLDKADSFTPYAYLNIDPEADLSFDTLNGAYQIALDKKKETRLVIPLRD